MKQNEKQQVKAYLLKEKAKLEDRLAGRILGGEMNLWTEYIPQERVQRMLFPRAAAMAEALGAPAGPKEFAGFLARLRVHEMFWPTVGIVPGAASRPLVLRVDLRDEGQLLSAQPRWREEGFDGSAEFEVRHGFLPLPDGWRPERAPEEQLPPLPVGNLESFAAADRPAGDVLAVALRHAAGGGTGYGAPEVLEIHENLAGGRPVALAHQPSGRYPGRGERPLTDGVRGGRFFDDGHWVGFEAAGLIAALDLGREMAVREASIRCIQDANAWIFLPREVRFEGSDDGREWFVLGTAAHDVPDKEQRKTIHEFTGMVDRPLRHLRVVADNFGVCPDWHPGRGEACWLFVDEIRLR